MKIRGVLVAGAAAGLLVLAGCSTSGDDSSSGDSGSSGDSTTGSDSAARQRATCSESAPCAPAAERRVRCNTRCGQDDEQEAITHSPAPRVPSRLFDDRLQETAWLVIRSRRIHDEASM